MQHFNDLKSVIYEKGAYLVSDNELLRTNDFVEIKFREHADMIYRLAYARTKSKFESDDILQEVFMRFMSCNTVFKSEEHIKAWFLRVTINCSNSHLSSIWSKKITSIDTMGDDTIVITPGEKSEVYYAVLNLPIKYRTVIHLFYYEEYSTAQIAKLMDMKEGTVRSTLSRARESLRKKLKGVEI